MKTLRLQLFLLLTLCFSATMNAQLPPGTSAPDWTATDINGVQHDMSDILESGKHVILEFSAIWCPPCWSFHQTGTLETLYDTYGPDGTDQIRVFYIEADQGTNTACLYGPTGCNGNTQGDWVTGHDFPFIDLMPGNANNMDSDYAVGYFPTIYAVSANGTNGVYEIGQQTNISVWESWFFESFDMELSASVIDAACPGEGEIQLAATNGSGSITYQWSNGATGENITGLSAGTYTVTATDDNGYELEETFVLNGPADPLAANTDFFQDVQCFGEASGEISITGTGGNGGYQYQWDNGMTTPSISNLPAGAYNLQITDAAGCMTTETYIISQPDFLALTNLPENADCGAESGSVVAFATGGVTPWSFDYGEGPNFTGTFSDILPGDYMMTVTDANGCAKVEPFSVEVTQGPDAIADAPESIDCNTSEVTVFGDGSSEGDDISYAWSSDDGAVASGADEINAIVSSAGTYTLAVTDNSTGCVTETTVEVSANIDAPMVDIVAPETLDCNVTMTTIDGSGSDSGDNISYAWSTENGNIISGATTTMIDVDAAGTYTLLTTNTDNGCTSAMSVDVALDDAPPAITVNSVELDCTVSEAELCADVDANTTVTWETPNGDVEATCITVSMAGDYIAKATGSNGCDASATSIVTLSADLPQVSIAEPETLTCTVTEVVIEAELDGNIDDFNISWMSPAGDIINTSDLSLSVAEAGTYTLDVVNNINGCSTSSSISVMEVIINPESGFSSELIDGVLSVTSNATGDPSAYSWSFGSTDQDTEIVLGETGTYEVCLTVTNDCGDDTYCEDVYFVSELLFDSSKSDALCNGEADGSLSVTPSGGEPDYTISWVGPNGFTSSELVLNDLVAGEYSMVLNDNYGYEKSATYTIAEPTALEQTLIEITDETNDDGNGSINIDVGGGTGDLTYEWSNGDIGNTLSDLTAGDYYVVVTDANGCSTEFGPFTVETTVGIGELDFVNAMSVYPVPAQNYLNVDIKLNNAEATQIRVIDALGKVMAVQNHSSKNINATIDVSEMPVGMYYLEFGNKKGRSLEKFVVIK